MGERALKLRVDASTHPCLRRMHDEVSFAPFSPDPIQRFQNKGLRHQRSLQLVFSRKIEQGQANKDGEQSLPRQHQHGDSHRQKRRAGDVLQDQPNTVVVDGRPGLRADHDAAAVIEIITRKPQNQPRYRDE